MLGDLVRVDFLVPCCDFCELRKGRNRSRSFFFVVFIGQLGWTTNGQLLENCHFDDSRLVHQFDDTIHLMVKYEKLDKGARKTVITRFLKRANDGRGLSNIGTEYIDRFACVLLNGRQVSRLCERADLWPTSGDFQTKNSIAIATALAAAKGDMCSFSHISQALAANGNFIPVSSGTSGDNMVLRTTGIPDIFVWGTFSWAPRTEWIGGANSSASCEFACGVLRTQIVIRKI
jgi:hypothetical protein